jgi:hypothetical protein
MTLTTWTPGRVSEKNEAILISHMAPKRFAKRTPRGWVPVTPANENGVGPTAPAFTPLEEPDVGIRRRRGRPPHVESNLRNIISGFRSGPPMKMQPRTGVEFSDELRRVKQPAAGCQPALVFKIKTGRAASAQAAVQGTDSVRQIME